MVIDSIRKKYDVKNKRVALKIYQKAVKDNSFSTVIGYSFLEELYYNMEQAKVPVNDLPRLPLKETVEERPGKGYNNKEQQPFGCYKEKTEQELIDKYETWEEELQERENALNGGNTNGTEDSGR